MKTNQQTNKIILVKPGQEKYQKYGMYKQRKRDNFVHCSLSDAVHVVPLPNNDFEYNLEISHNVSFMVFYSLNL